MRNRRFILGIDQGSTHTRAVICDSAGVILGLGKTFGACHSIDGMERAMKAVAEAAQMAREAAKVDSNQIELLFGGLTGADWRDEYDLLTENLEMLQLANQVRVVNDSIIALRGGTQASYGAILIAGTGANCAILSPSGESYIYHYYVDDYLQGGTGLGRSALWTIYRAETGREVQTKLTEAVLEALEFASVDELLRAQAERRLPHDRVKELAPLIFRLAKEGDFAAQKIIRAFGVGLAELVTAGFRRFSMREIDVEVVLSGSIFKGPGTLLQDTIQAEIQRDAPHARLVNSRYEPVVGAMILGLEACGVEIDPSVG
ncbi:MAG: hypothetical protein EHM41_19935, partial [Chloroflexi bacterium]